MDVHHHSHLPHQSKPWKQYLTEGLMIFVAAGSVVTKDVPTNTIVAGIPAIHVKNI